MDAKPIVVGVDGSADSVRALRWATDYAQATGAPVRALMSWNVSTIYGDTFFGNWDQSGVEAKHRELLETAVREALGEGARTRFMSEPPVPRSGTIEHCNLRGSGFRCKPPPRNEDAGPSHYLARFSRMMGWPFEALGASIGTAAGASTSANAGTYAA